jgi:hypothetical protein
MSFNKSYYKQELSNSTLIGSEQNRNLLHFQTKLGIALHGGSFPINTNHSGAVRLVSNINFLNKTEKQELVFSGTIYFN